MRWLTMPEYLDEREEYRFPPATSATPRGVVAYGGNLSPGVLLSAYRQGIFPWPSTPVLLQWCSPDPRFIILPETLSITESARKALKKALQQGSPYRLTLDAAFSDVIGRCASVPRPGQPGTWIFPNLIQGYTELHRLGYAHSVEVWKGSTLIGGLYGVSIGAAFFGEFDVQPREQCIQNRLPFVGYNALRTELRLCRLPGLHALSCTDGGDRGTALDLSFHAQRGAYLSHVERYLVRNLLRFSELRVYSLFQEDSGNSTIYR